MPRCDEAGTEKPCCRRARGGGSGASVEAAALAALLFEDGHGYDMRKTILEMTDGDIEVDVGGLYRTLRRLENEGAVVSRWDEETTGPRRREYEITEHGVELARQWLLILRQREKDCRILGEQLEKGLKL